MSTSYTIPSLVEGAEPPSRTLMPPENHPKLAPNSLDSPTEPAFRSRGPMEAGQSSIGHSTPHRSYAQSSRKVLSSTSIGDKRVARALHAVWSAPYL
ncbi:hypothetical protein B296_00001774 [Ensete ventricosum]|uniref:Uncharacterized protein n=1 Tax=Ensete ventricosum TaxID=4639 RepID=A0A427BA49_ENSVE|nr:hypothetical protein B296_00001774 [Ensete ventricosum]